MAPKTPPRTKPRTPRVHVTLSAEARPLLDRLSVLTGSTKTALVAELVDAGLPAVVSAIEALELVKQGRNHEAERLLNRFAHAATAQLAQEQLELHQAVDGRTVKGKRSRRGGSGRPT